VGRRDRRTLGLGLVVEVVGMKLTLVAMPFVNRAQRGPPGPCRFQGM
jgi:hypothetical protein